MRSLFDMVASATTCLLVAWMIVAVGSIFGPSPILMILVVRVLIKNPPFGLLCATALLEASQLLSASSKLAKGHYVLAGYGQACQCFDSMTSFFDQYLTRARHLLLKMESIPE